MGSIGRSSLCHVATYSLAEVQFVEMLLSQSSGHFQSLWMNVTCVHIIVASWQDIFRMIGLPVLCDIIFHLKYISRDEMFVLIHIKLFYCIPCLVSAVRW